MQLIVELAPVRTGDEPQGTALGIDRVEVKGELDAEAVRGWIGPVVGMPSRIADIAIGISADADDVVAVEAARPRRRGRFVFEQAGVTGGCAGAASSSSSASPP